MRKKRTSKALELARQRLAGLKKIAPKPNLGANVTEESYEAAVNAFSNDLDAYNGEIAGLDEQANRLDTSEQHLKDFNQRVLAAVRGQFGPDSNELEEVGGRRRSDRKRPARFKKAPVAA